MVNKLSGIKILIALVAVLNIDGGINGQVNQPLIKIPFIKESPIIDGKINEVSWNRAASITGFVNWSLDKYIRDSVTVYLYFDDTGLNVAFMNSDPEASLLNNSVSPKGPRDTFLWGRNHASVSLGFNEVNIRVMADPKGTMTDWKNNSIEWNGNWQYAASINQSDWTAEFSIPWNDLGISKPADETEISLSLSRSYPKGESSDWSGKCFLSEKPFIKCDPGKWPQPVPDRNTLSFKAENFGNEAAQITCELEIIPLKGKPEFINQSGQGPSSELMIRHSSDPLRYTADFKVPGNGSVNEDISYTLPYEGSYYASLIVKSADGGIIRRSVDYWFTVEPNREKLKLLIARTGESIASMARISYGVADKYKAEAEMILSNLKEMESSADSFWKSGRWKELTEAVSKKEIKVDQLLHKVRWGSLNNWTDDDDFGIATAHSILKLKKDDIFPLPLSNSADISLAGNEYESFQLAILPFGKEIKNLIVEVSDLTDGSGNKIPKDKIEVSLVDYNKIGWQADYIAEKGWHPDPLIPFKNGVNLEGNEICRPLWITVYAPSGTKAGDYKGKISVKADGMKSAGAVINCRIWGFDLPVESHLKTHSWDEIGYFSDFYNLEEYPLDWYMNFCGLLLKNRFNPGSAGVNYLSEKPDKKGKYDFSKVEKILAYCMERGLTRFSITQMKKGLYAPGEEAAVYKFIAAYSKFLREKGWLDKALVELWDEPTDLEWPYIKERAEKIKKIDPGLRLQLFAEGGPYNFYDKSTDKYGLNQLVDIWAPVNIIESPESQARGGEIWTYFCTLARESAPNFFIDCPAIYQRSIAWYCWMYGVDGFEHWSSNYFWRNVRKGEPMDKKWPNVPWDSRTYYYFNGEGQLVYPGPEGAVYSSIRLENFRDGMEDYEYLFKLKESLSGIEGISSDSEINQIRQLLSPENYLLYKYPRKIKVTLENTLRYPDQPERIMETRKKIAEAIEKLQKK